MFYLVTDSTCDLPLSFYKDNNIGLVHLSCLMGGVTYGKNKEIDIKEFYETVRGGELPTTSQVNPEEAGEEFEEIIKAGHKEILYIAFSSGLSATYNSVSLAARETMEAHPDVKIIVVDSLCASMGEGLFVYYVDKLRKEGKSLEEVAEWAENNKLNIGHVFTVEDLNHLWRGGRVSKATAIIGTLAGIKPVLHVDNEGHLINIEKARGRKKSLNMLVDLMEARMGQYKDANSEMIMISHGDSLEDAEFVKAEIEKRYGYKNFMINPIGPVIGSHAGPGTIALFFLGERR